MIAALILVERPKILQNKQGGHGKPMTAIVTCNSNALLFQRSEKKSHSALSHTLKVFSALTTYLVTPLPSSW